MGQEGWAVTLVTPDDGPYLTAIEKLINKQIEQERFPGIDVSPVEKPKKEASAEGEAAKPAEPKRAPGMPRWAKPTRRRR